MAARRKSNKHLIARAIKRPGALTRKAERAGMSVPEFARREQHASGKTGEQARFYTDVLSKVRHGKIRTPRKKRVKVRSMERRGSR